MTSSQVRPYADAVSKDSLPALGSALPRAIPAALEAYAARRLGQHASAICYRMLVSIAPLAVVLVALFGIVLRDAELQARLIDWIVDLLPFDAGSRQEIEDAIVAVASPASLLGFLGLFAFMWTATGVMGAIRIGLEAALDVREGRPAARSKLVDAAGVIGAAILVLALVVSGAMGDALRTAIEELADRHGVSLPGVGLLLGSRVIQLAVTVSVVAAIYRFVPARRLPGRDILVAAAATSAMMFLISIASAFVYGGAGALSVVYGSLAALFTFLYAVYLSACALLLGAALAGALSLPPGEPGPPLPEQIRSAVIGLFRRPR
jgi:membrane protein